MGTMSNNDKLTKAKQDFADFLSRLSDAANSCKQDKHLSDPLLSIACLSSIMGEVADSGCRLKNALLDEADRIKEEQAIAKAKPPQPYATIYGKKWNYQFNRKGEVIAIQAKTVLEDLSGNSKAEWERIAPEDRFVLPEKLVIPIQVPDETFPDLGYRFITCKSGYHDPLDNIWGLIEIGKDDDNYYSELYHLMAELQGSIKSQGVCFSDPVTGKLLMMVDYTVTE